MKPLPSSNTPEKSFYLVLEDLRDHLPDLTLVGGWVPFIYARHVWKTETTHLVTTADIDFGLTGRASVSAEQTVFETLSKLDYREHHLNLGRLWPVVLYKNGQIPVEFLADSTTETKAIAAILGSQIHVNKLDKLGFLLRNRIHVRLRIGTQTRTLFCPRPSTFLIHKLETFTERDGDLKKAKDLFYAYFILRCIPDIAALYQEARGYRGERAFSQVEKNIGDYFSRLTSWGCLWVERENGPDELIQDVRKDAFERFNKLKEELQAF